MSRSRRLPARMTVALILALASSTIGCAPAERTITARPPVDPRLKEPCPHPADREAMTYGELVEVAIDLELWGECNERKVIDLSKSIE